MVNRFGSIVVSVNGIVDVNDSTVDVAGDSVDVIGCPVETVAPGSVVVIIDFSVDVVVCIDPVVCVKLDVNDLEVPVLTLIVDEDTSAFEV